MSKITVVKASHIQPFVHFLNGINAPTVKMLHDVGLDIKHLENPDNLIPELPIWTLFENASKELAMDDFGFQVSEHLSLDSYGLFGKYVLSAHNLEEALHRFIAAMGEQSNCPQFWLEDKGSSVWFCRKGSVGMRIGSWQIEQHVVSLMVYLVRSFTNKNWIPPYAWLKTQTLTGIGKAKVLKGSKISSSKPYTSISIPKVLFSANNSIKQSNVKSSNMTIANNSRDIVRELLRQEYFSLNYCVSSIANQLGMSIRQTQRILKSEGIHLKNLIEELRFERAQELLKERNKSVLEISLFLEYSDAANFSRAFKRWSGVCPTEFREKFHDE